MRKLLFFTKAHNKEIGSKLNYHSATEEISQGMKPAGYTELVKRYPARIAELDLMISENFDEATIDSYKKSIIAGLKKINYWRY